MRLLTKTPQGAVFFTRIALNQWYSRVEIMSLVPANAIAMGMGAMPLALVAHDAARRSTASSVKAFAMNDSARVTQRHRPRAAGVISLTTVALKAQSCSDSME